jgi:hypothetical protein
LFLPELFSQHNFSAYRHSAIPHLLLPFHIYCYLPILHCWGCKKIQWECWRKWVSERLRHTLSVIFHP